jgi:hypothetical protein
MGPDSKAIGVTSYQRLNSQEQLVT